MVALTEQMIKGKTRLDKLDDVKNLNLWGQDLDDVSVLAKLPNVEVLSLSVNRVSSLKEFRHCTKLQELYLRKNDVRDLNEIQHLRDLRELRVLWLSDNPCADHPNYKQFVARALPNLKKLDNEDLVPGGAGGGGGHSDGSAPTPGPAPVARTGSGAIPPQYAPPPSAGPSPYGTPYSDRGGSRGSGVGASPDQAGYGPGPAGGFPPRSAGGGGGGRSTKNILYAVMALLGELEDEDLIYVRREIEQRIGGR
ncbi:hypothetical protein HYH03_009519 [Edaphochlamys debaryana]|uniref:Leucine rich repeat protein n=1 Tax=Edaphochlamys debaryana TaxID=47281 RepID=A0A836BYI9_9CHLO|nr:hypothetical protein HYH03_009519 [Edaphochlamys debaryana]|eukprot:KAG2492279.1 hypothetical protein HYH03_009519 [Edaphochlamys debaryana]